MYILIIDYNYGLIMTAKQLRSYVSIRDIEIEQNFTYWNI